MFNVKMWAQAFLITMIAVGGGLSSTDGSPVAEGSEFGDLSQTPRCLIGVDDQIRFFVWQHPELSFDSAVRPDGKVSFPLIDDVDAEGLTVAELDSAITRHLAEFILSPHVTVSILEFKSRRVAVLGEVQRPGIFPLTGRLTLLQAVALADYTKRSADLTSVVLVRVGPKNQARVSRINLKTHLESPERILEDIVLQDNDVIFVPKSFISKLDDFLEFFTRKIQPVVNFNVYNKLVQ